MVELLSESNYCTNFLFQAIDFKCNLVKKGENTNQVQVWFKKECDFDIIKIIYYN